MTTTRKSVIVIAVAVILSAAGIVTAGRPLRIQQVLCYDRNEVTGICGHVATIVTREDELHGNIHRADSLRQVKAADLAYTSLTGRTIVNDPIADCPIGQPCTTCYTKYAVIGGLTACDGICLDCLLRTGK